MKQLATRTSDFEFVGLDYIDNVKQVLSPNDTMFQAGYQGNLDVINIRQAWDRTVAWADIKVAVLDGGLRGTHEDLVGKQQQGFDYTNRTYTIPNQTNNDDQTFPPGFEGHGTRVAGIAAAATNNAKGIAGAGFNSSLIPVKVFNQNGVWIAGGRGDPIIQAAAMGALVINMSYESDVQDDWRCALVRYLLAEGVVDVLPILPSRLGMRARGSTDRVTYHEKARRSTGLSLFRWDL